MLTTLVNWLLATIGHMGYWGIVLLMAMESSVLPVPSELVVPPAGYLAQQGQMNIFLVIFCGILGSLLGAYANYFVSQHIGRPLILKYGKYVGVTQNKLERVERFFLKHGEFSTFVGRLIPVIRHLISIPAGLSRMNHLKFSLYTVLGSAIWVTVLAVIGYFIGANQELVMRYSQQALYFTLGACAVLTVFYWLYRSHKTHRT